MKYMKYNPRLSMRENIRRNVERDPITIRDRQTAISKGWLKRDGRKKL